MKKTTNWKKLICQFLKVLFGEKRFCEGCKEWRNEPLQKIRVPVKHWYEQPMLSGGLFVIDVIYRVEMETLDLCQRCVDQWYAKGCERDLSLLRNLARLQKT